MIIARYTREAGVRDLERKLILLCQKAAKSIATGEKDKVRISERNLKEYLGKEVHTIRMANKRAQVGIVRGLAWTAVGGETLEVEVGIMPGNGKLLLTGKLGDVMKESAQIALTYVRSQTAKLVKDSYYVEHDIHIHVPEGAVPKDGPSAGVTMATALYSAVTGWKVRADIAMTGEISLRGSVLAIGGLKEKMLAAKAAGIAQVFIPKDNESDLAEFSEDILEGITVTTVSSVKEIWKQSIETPPAKHKNLEKAWNNRMKVTSVNLETVCGITSKLPENDKLEVAFAGRSNVGKSSLINALMNRKSYARTSQQPGKTQTINFYNINELLYFVDLPGYGYAKVSQDTVKKWGKMIDGYLHQSKVLRLVFLLVDIRHKPNQNDMQMYEWCVNYGFNPIIIATKSDKIKRSQLQKQIKQIKDALQVVDGTPVIPFSALNKSGRDEIWEYIDMMYEGFQAERSQ